MAEEDRSIASGDPSLPEGSEKEAPKHVARCPLCRQQVEFYKGAEGILRPKDYTPEPE